MELIDLQCPEDFKSKFLDGDINFCKYCVLSSRLFPELITHMKQVGKHVWHYKLQRKCVRQNEACQLYAVFADFKSSLF